MSPDLPIRQVATIPVVVRRDGLYLKVSFGEAGWTDLHEVPIQSPGTLSYTKERVVPIMPSWGATWAVLQDIIYPVYTRNGLKNIVEPLEGCKSLMTVVKPLWEEAITYTPLERKFLADGYRKLLRWKIAISPRYNTFQEFSHVRFYSGSNGISHSPRSLYNLLAGLLFDLPADRKKWFMVDLERMQPENLADFLIRASVLLPNSFTIRYISDKNLSMKYPAHFMRSRSTVLMYESMDLGKELDYVAKQLQRVVKRPFQAGTSGPWVVPDTPWHAYLNALAYENLGKVHRSGHIVYKCELHDQRHVDNYPWCLIPEHSVAKWISESDHREVIKTLGWDHFTNKLVGMEYELLTNEIGWDHPLNGWHKEISSIIGCKNRDERVPEKEDAGVEDMLRGVFDDIEYRSNHWLCLDDIIRDALKYIADGARIYNRYEQKETTFEGHTWRLQPIKGSFHRMLKDAKYNHNVERFFLVMEDQKAESDGEMWVPETGLPSDVEEYRVKRKKVLKYLGAKHHTCVGGYTNTKDKVYYNSGSVVASVDPKRGLVVECRDDRNKITPDSQKFQAKLARYYKATTVLSSTPLPVEKYQHEDWMEEYCWQFQDSELFKKNGNFGLCLKIDVEGEEVCAYGVSPNMQISYESRPQGE